MICPKCNVMISQENESRRKGFLSGCMGIIIKEPEKPFHKLSSLKETHNSWVDSCPKCGYVDYESSFLRTMDGWEKLPAVTSREEPYETQVKVAEKRLKEKKEKEALMLYYWALKKIPLHHHDYKNVLNKTIDLIIRGLNNDYLTLEEKRDFLNEGLCILNKQKINEPITLRETIINQPRVKEKTVQTTEYILNKDENKKLIEKFDKLQKVGKKIGIITNPTTKKDELKFIKNKEIKKMILIGEKFGFQKLQEDYKKKEILVIADNLLESGRINDAFSAYYASGMRRIQDCVKNWSTNDIIKHIKEIQSEKKMSTKVKHKEKEIEIEQEITHGKNNSFLDKIKSFFTK